MTDTEIIDKVKAGNQQVFTLLLERYQERVFRMAMGFVHQREEAEDLTQEIFIKVYQQLSSFSGDAAFATWLFRVTVNTGINHVNRMKRRQWINLSAELFESVFNQGTDDQNPEQELISNERDAAVQKAIDSLGDKQKTAFVLSKYDEMSQSDIATIMEISEGAVEQHLQRAKKNLQKKLSRTVGKL